MRLIAIAALLAAAAAGADFDLIIRNGRIIDGTGNPWFRADVGIKAGRIAAIGVLANATADKEIDAVGRVIAPGFIDVHTHIERAAERIPRGDNFLLDGVTTVITGNCGGSADSLADWFTKLQNLGIGPNIASLVGHNTVRAQVMGRANRAATPDEIAAMQKLVEQGMRDGAVGFSTGLIYIPGTYSNTAEVVALARSAAKFGGTYASHLRDEGERVLDAITEAVTVGKETGMPVELSHFKIDNKRLWGASEKSLALVEKFRSEGVDVVVDQYPYDRSSTNLGITLPSWALADGPEAIKERLSTGAVRAKVITEMKAKLDELGMPDFDYAMVARYEADRSYEGRTIKQIADSKGKEGLDGQVEIVLEIIAAGNASMVFHEMGDIDVERIMRYPFTAVASDGGIVEYAQGVPHPRSYGTNARVLAEFVRKRGTIRLEDAIRRMTTMPARTFHFRDRGILREGAAADIVVFDPSKVQDKATFQKPHQYSEGFDYVLVNGKIAVESGKLTDARSGQILRHSPDARP